MIVHGFVDGAYLREMARELGYEHEFTNPRRAVHDAVYGDVVQRMFGGPVTEPRRINLGRVTYYDAKPDKPEQESDTRLQQYWQVVERLEDCDLGFGTLRGRPRGAAGRRRQKGVDTLLVCDLLVGAFTGLYQIAVLVAGDSDFVPVVQEVRRRGPSVVVVADARSASQDLLASADRIVQTQPPGAPRAEGAIGLRPLDISGP